MSQRTKSVFRRLFPNQAYVRGGLYMLAAAIGLVLQLDPAAVFGCLILARIEHVIGDLVRSVRR
jgi:hypothetical protein